MLNAIVWMKRTDEHFDNILNASYGQKMTWQRAHSYDDVLGFLATDEEFKLVITILDPSDIEILYQIKLCQEQEPSLSIIAIFDTTDVASIDQALSLIIGNNTSNEAKKDSELPCLGETDSEEASAILDQTDDFQPNIDGLNHEDHIPPPDCRLPPRQRDVLGLIMVGKSNKEIARDLALSEGTVKVHCMALFKEMSVSNRTQAALMAESLLRVV